MPKAKQFVRPPKKQKAKATAPETADDFQQAADREEEAGGKHRAGDSQKSARAFLRALELYDQGLKRYPKSFDLAYNKARLMLEITQQPALVQHVGLPLVKLLEQTLQAHRAAMKVNEEDANLLFNTSQVLTALAEELSKKSQSNNAMTHLQQSLELLSGCLSRQEMMLEQQQMDFEDAEEGGVQLDPDEQPASTPTSALSEQSAHVETPLTPGDLLDTVHASLSALTTMVSLVDDRALQTYGDMAHMLTEKKAESYIRLLPEDAQAAARFAVGLDRAIFIAAFVDAQFNWAMVELETSVARLDAFDLPGKEQSAHALSAEGEARTELILSVFDRGPEEVDEMAETCWKQLTIAQDLYAKATKLTTEDAKERKAGNYYSKGNVELLRWRLASCAINDLPDSIKDSSLTLLTNAKTYFKGAARLAGADGERKLELKAQQRWVIAEQLTHVHHEQEEEDPPFDINPPCEHISSAVRLCEDEGYISSDTREAVMSSIGLSDSEPDSEADPDFFSMAE